MLTQLEACSNMDYGVCFLSICCFGYTDFSTIAMKPHSFPEFRLSKTSQTHIELLPTCLKEYIYKLEPHAVFLPTRLKKYLCKLEPHVFNLTKQDGTPQHAHMFFTSKVGDLSLTSHRKSEICHPYFGRIANIACAFEYQATSSTNNRQSIKSTPRPASSKSIGLSGMALCTSTPA